MCENVLKIKYQRMQSLGTGATATTYLAKDLDRGERLVAQKLFSEDWSERYRDQIDQEFGFLARFSHPYLVGVQDFGLEGKQCYLVTEYVKGEPLLNFLQGKDLNTVLWFFSQILEALDYLYFHNIVHLDLKPENILVSEAPEGGERRIRLLDFGLASWATPEAAKGESVGTPPFTAPEFVLRRGVDTRSDLYSIGVLMYFLLSGELPFSGEDPLTILNGQLNQDPPSLKSKIPEIHPKLSDWVSRLMSRDPEARPASPREALRELQADLGEVFSGTPLVPPPLFEDWDLLFREKEMDEFWESFSGRGGVWTITGTSGAGKSFFARWLQRKGWQEEKRVHFLQGENLALMNPGPRNPDDIHIVDDAHLGPVETWLQQHPDIPTVLFLEEGFAKAFQGLGKTFKLRPLSKKSIRALLEEKLGSFPDVFFQNWWRDSQGNPLGLVRQGRQYLRQGIFEFKEGSWRFSQEAYQSAQEIRETGTGPDTVLKKILALSRVALDAATLAQWSGQSQKEVEEQLEAGVSQGSLERKVMEGKVLFRTLAVEKVFGPELTPAQAEHLLEEMGAQGRYQEGIQFLEAYYRDELPRDVDKQILKAEFLGGGQQYPPVFAQLTPKFLKNLSPKQKAQCHEILGKAYLFTGKHDEAQKLLAQAEHFYENEGDLEGQGRILLHLGILAQREGKLEAAGKYYHEAGELNLSGKMLPLIRGVARLNEGNLYYDRAEYEKARPLYEESLSLLRGTGHGPVTAQAYLNFAHLHFYQGHPFLAEQSCREALRLAIHYQFPLTQGYALLLLAQIDERRGNPQRQGTRLLEAVEIFARASLAFEWIQAKVNQAYYFESQGNFVEGERAAGEALKRSRELKVVDLIGKSQVALGKVLKNISEQLDPAASHLDQALKLFTEQGNREMKWQCEFERAEVERLRGHREAAEHFYDQAEKTLGELLARLPDTLQEAYLRDKKAQLIESGRLKMKRGH